jgi:hypothetical protein
MTRSFSLVTYCLLQVFDAWRIALILSYGLKWAGAASIILMVLKGSNDRHGGHVRVETRIDHPPSTVMRTPRRTLDVGNGTQLYIRTRICSRTAKS